MTSQIYASLSPAAPGDPFVNEEHAWDAAARYPMRAPHLLLVIAFLILGLLLGAELVRRYGHEELIAVFMPVMALGWYAGFRLFPRCRQFPGRCSRCGYNRLGLPPTHACPECGARDDGTGECG